MAGKVIIYVLLLFGSVNLSLAYRSRTFKWDCIFRIGTDPNRCHTLDGDGWECECCEGWEEDEVGKCTIEPTFLYCPSRFTHIPVFIEKESNIGHLDKTFRAVDWRGHNLPIDTDKSSSLSFRHCQCSTRTQLVTLYSEEDIKDNRAVCQFTVSIHDLYDPVFVSCPKNQYRSSKDIISWTVPRVKDNVGIKTLIRPKYKNYSRFEPGNHNLDYNATDFSGNSAKCEFSIFVYNAETYSPNRLDDHSVVISGTIIGALLIILVVLSIAMFRFCRRQRRRPSNPTVRFSSNLRRTQNFHEGRDNPVYTIYNNDPPPYDVIFGPNKVPDYSATAELPSYEDVQRWGIQSFENSNFAFENGTYESNETLPTSPAESDETGSQSYYEDVEEPIPYLENQANQCTEQSGVHSDIQIEHTADAEITTNSSCSHTIV